MRRSTRITLWSIVGCGAFWGIFIASELYHLAPQNSAPAMSYSGWFALGCFVLSLSIVCILGNFAKILENNQSNNSQQIS